MEVPEKLLEVLKKDGVVAIGTLGPEGPHMVNTWNSYVRVSEDGRLLIPTGYFRKTEANIAVNDKVLVASNKPFAPAYFDSRPMTEVPRPPERPAAPTPPPPSPSPCRAACPEPRQRPRLPPPPDCSSPTV